MTEYTQEYAALGGGRRVDVDVDYSEICPRRAGDRLYEANVQHDLGLTDEDRVRGGKHILKARDIARG